MSSLHLVLFSFAEEHRSGKYLFFYSSEDIEKIYTIKNYIESSGWSTWLADRDAKNDWREDVEKVLLDEDCKLILACWSSNSRNNQFVTDEVNLAKESGKTIFNICLDNAKTPIGFGNHERIPIANWNGGKAC